MLERTLFADTLNATWPERARRGWTTLTSFGLQALVTGVLLVLPLLRPSGMPSFHQLSTPISLGEPLEEAPVVASHGGANQVPSEPSKFFFRRPSPMPTALRPSGDEEPPAIANSGPSIPGGVRGDPRGVANLFDNSSRSVLPAALPAAAPAKLLRLSHISEGSLLHKVQPPYPALARSARVQGAVVLQAVISKQGTIENLVVLAGHPLLVPAALNAVRQWRYQPYILNAEPVAVETQITVNFSLAGN
jgi:periplasmic protein TonB